MIQSLTIYGGKVIYAIIEAQNDIQYNADEYDILIFYTKEEYEEWIENAEEEQPYTGLTWRTKYRK